MHPRTLASIALAACLVLAAVPAPAAAQSDDGLSGVFDDSDTDDSSALETVLAFASGWTDRAQNWAAGIGSDATADDTAGDATAAFNTDVAARTSWANARTDASTDADVLEVTFEVEDTEAVRYVVADVNGSDYENVSMVSETSRTPDESCTLEGSAARMADDEIERFDSRFVDAERNVTKGYLVEMAAKYGGSVDCSFSLSGGA